MLQLDDEHNGSLWTRFRPVCAKDRWQRPANRVRALSTLLLSSQRLVLQCRWCGSGELTFLTSILAPLCHVARCRYHIRDHTCLENDPTAPFYDEVHGVYHHFFADHPQQRRVRSYAIFLPSPSPSSVIVGDLLLIAKQCSQ